MFWCIVVAFSVCYIGRCLETGTTKAFLMSMTAPVHLCEKCCMGYEYTSYVCHALSCVNRLKDFSLDQKLLILLTNRGESYVDSILRPVESVCDVSEAL
jgi:hypothetical protein